MGELTLGSTLGILSRPGVTTQRNSRGRGWELDTVHAYLSDDILREAYEDEGVELAAAAGILDPLVGQMVLNRDAVPRRWEPSARTYLDHLSPALAAHLAVMNRFSHREHLTGVIRTRTRSTPGAIRAPFVQPAQQEFAGSPTT